MRHITIAPWSTFRMIIAYLLKPRTSQIDLIPAKMIQTNWETTRNDPKFQNWGNLEFSTSFCFSNFGPCTRIWAFCAKKYQLSNLKESLHVHCFDSTAFKSKIWKLILFGPKCPNLGIWARHFRKQMSDLKSASSKQVTSRISLKLES